MSRNKAECIRSFPEAGSGRSPRLGLMGAAIHEQQPSEQFRPTIADTRPSADHNIVEDLRFNSPTGGLAIIGPTSLPLRGMSGLLGTPNVESIEVSAQDLMTWDTAGATIVTLTREVSSAMRDGKTAVVYLDAHVGRAPAAPVERHEFMCCRLSRILVGLADAPPYLALHGGPLARAVLVDGHGGHSPTVAVITDGLPVVRLGESSMFPGTPVSICSENDAATASALAVDWFEAHRD